MLPSILVATIAFFLSVRLSKRYLDHMEIPKGLTRGALIFSIALLVSYVAGWLAHRLVA